MTEEAGGKHPQLVLSCDSCDHAEKTNSKTYPVKCKASKPIPMMVHEYCIAWFGYVGCASHSSAPQPAPSSHLSAGKADPTRYMSEEQRKYILSFKEEDPLLMAYVEGQKAAEQRIKDVIAELEHLEDECAAKAIETADTSWGFHYGGMADGFKKAISLLRDGGKP